MPPFLNCEGTGYNWQVWLRLAILSSGDPQLNIVALDFFAYRARIVPL